MSRARPLDVPDPKGENMQDLLDRLARAHQMTSQLLERL